MVPIIKRLLLHTSSIRQIPHQALKAGITAFLYSVAVVYLTYYLLTWLPQKAPSTNFVNSIFFWWPLIIMWTPGILSILFRIISRDGFSDVGWKPGKPIYWVLAITVPFLVATLTYLAGYLANVVTINGNNLRGSMFTDQYGILPSAWPAFTPDSLFLRLLIKLGVVATLGLLPNFVFALGEELGWRGYLQPRLTQSGIPFPLILCNIVWALWHIPWLRYQNSLEAALFVFLIILLGIWIGWLRIKSGSVWVAAMAHAAHNGFLLTLYLSSFRVNKPLWVSEAGIFPVLAYGIILVLVYLAVCRRKERAHKVQPVHDPTTG